ncbi:MAG: hypothetical protein LBP83_05805 [Dysgonamonadaceae bacterium]|jgi:hypothetical protein|nr:hypothetical protein [Dysgonamonadaceae bacterium]
MKKGLFSIAIFFVSTCLYAPATMSDFSLRGYRKQIMYTSLKGEFEEFHDQADIVESCRQHGEKHFDDKLLLLI